MRILALDLATKTGWAHSDGPSGVWDFSILRDESGGMRLVRFSTKLKEIMRGLGADVIVFEAVSAGAGAKTNLDGIKIGSKLQGILELFVEQTEGVESRSYYLQEIKAHAIPAKKVKRDKDAMVAAAKRKWPEVEIIDDNHADALFLLDLAQREYGTGDS